MKHTGDMYCSEYFQENLKELLYKKRIKQKEFAKMLDVAPPIVNNWLSGRCDPTLYSLMRICNALNVSPDWLLRKNKFVDFEE